MISAKASVEADAFLQTRKRVPSAIDSNSLTWGFWIVGHPDEGGDGAKLGATAQKPWGKGNSGVLGRSKVQLDQTGTQGRAYLFSMARRCR